MTILVAFASIEGQTGKIARFVEGAIRTSGRETALVDISEGSGPVSFDGVSEVILAAPVHERKHPRPFEVFLASQHDRLGSRRTLLISVSLSAAFEDGLEEANEYVVELKMRTGFTPDAEMLVAGAVRPGSYDYFEAQIVRHVVLHDRDFSPGSADHEFTDWDALSSGVLSFLEADP
jgi:menaquinone-dependent protoporphyrinogen oxidase